MKKLSLLLMFLFSTWAANAQFVQHYEITFKDVNGNLWPTSLQLTAQNSDSLTNGQAFFDWTYSGYYGGNTGTYRIIDSVTIPASYTGNQITFAVTACGSVYHFDTTLSQNSVIAHVFTLPCSYSCDASFNAQINELSQLTMSSTDLNSTHAWYLDNVLIATTRTHSQQISGAGNHLLAHTVHNGTYCSDSAVQVLTVDSACSASLNFNLLGSNNVEFIASTLPAGRYCRLEFGDGNMQNFYSNLQDTINHQYSVTNNYTAKLSVFGQGCMDSSLKTLNTSGTSCDASFTYSMLSPYQLKLTRTDSSVGSTEWVLSGWGSGGTVLYGHSVVITTPNYDVIYNIRCNGYINNAQSCFTTQTVHVNRCGLIGSPYAYYGLLHLPGSHMTTFDSAIIYRIAYDSANQTLTARDSIVIYDTDSGAFYFQDCYRDSRSLFKAALLAGSSIYANYLPTYADSAVLWSGAREYGQSSTVDIHMKAGTNPGGPGFIGGYISQGANKHGAGLDGIQVTLFTAQDQPVAFAISFNAGRYEFNNLALGSYKVLVEIPGKPSSIHYVTLSQSKQSADELNFEVNSSDISVLNSLIELKTSFFKAYPNPSTQYLTLESLNGETLEFVYVIDIQGKRRILPYTHSGMEKLVVDLNSVEPGVYMIEAGNGQQISRIRIIKK